MGNFDRHFHNLIRGIAVVIAVSFVISAFNLNMVQIQAAEIMDADVDEPASGNVFLGLEGRYYADDQAALDRINAIRYEACTRGDVPDPRNTSRMLSEEDYVPIKWSTDLERVARVRAYESALTLAHSRLNGKSLWTVSSNGVSSYAENLAWNWSTSMLNGIAQWYGEMNDWVNQNSSAVTGHYTSMINPRYTYVGLGDFYSSKALFRNTLSAEFNTSAATLDQTMLDPTDIIIQKVEVQSSYISSYTINEDSEIEVGDTIDIELLASATIYAYGANRTYVLPVIGGVTYESSDNSIVEIPEDETLTAKSPGVAEISAIVSDKTVASFEVTVWDHKEEIIPAVAATCTETGLTEGKKCSICGEILAEQEVVPALGHDLVHHEGKAATCTEAGWEAYDTCSRCDYTTYKEIPATGHNYEDGYCTICGSPEIQFILQDDGTYDYYYRDVNDTEKYGFVNYKNNKFVVANGKLAAEVNGLFQDPEDTDSWYYCAGGQVVDYTGLAIYNEEWFYVENGKLNTTLKGFVEYNGSLFYVGAGMIQRAAQGLCMDPNDSSVWYYLADGQVVDYTGLALYDGHWFYVIDGRFATEFSGEVEYNGATFNIVNGELDE